MTTVVFKDLSSGNTCQVSGICLAVTGKSQDHLAELNSQLDFTNVYNIGEVEFIEIFRKDCVDSKRFIPIMEKYLKLFPFFRTVKSSAKHILETGHCVFDAKNYTQNEIMYAMFHIRWLSYSSSTIFNKSPAEVMLKYQEYGFWKAYLLALCNGRCISSWPAYDSPPIWNKTIHGDANTFVTNLIPFSRFKAVLSGNAPTRRYVYGTYNSNYENGRCYPKNITKYLTDPLINEKSLFDFHKEFAQRVKKSVTISERRDMFGNVVSITSGKVTKQDIIASLNATLREFKTNSRGKIC